MIVPTGLEGTYRVDLRGTDNGGRSKTAPAWSTAGLSSPAWRGSADSTGPRLNVCLAPIANGNYLWWVFAQDYNLAEAGTRSGCPLTITPTRTYYSSPWFASTAPPGTQKLYKLTFECVRSVSTLTGSAKACDSSNNCTSVSLEYPPLCSTVPAAQAQAALSASLSASGAALQEAETAAAAAGKPRKAEIAFASSVLTATHFHAPQAAVITGTVSGTLDFSSVEVSVGGRTSPAVLSDPAAEWPFTRTWTPPTSCPMARCLTASRSVPPRPRR